MRAPLKTPCNQDTPGVNPTTVAEHAFGRRVGLGKHFKTRLREVQAGQTPGPIGMGCVGKKVIQRGDGTDVANVEPPRIGRRAAQSLGHPAMRATLNRVNFLNGHRGGPAAQPVF